MRLLSATNLTLEQFDDDNSIPPYAILSHTWGNDEITAQDVLSGEPSRFNDRASFSKIQGCCRQAVRDGLGYVWVDTCCIDKTSSAELSEAINSMFRWYRKAAFCYAYLADVTSPLVDKDNAASVAERSGHGGKVRIASAYQIYQSCRWFTRGWTLQELIAPGEVIFFDVKWRRIGSKSEDLSDIEKITGIGRRFLQDVEELQRASVAQRMSWASKRRTTRREDRAYCLLGIFGINMPLLYGEGDRAFIRLQEEIMKDSDDQSLFAWGLGISLDDRDQGNGGGLFATSPEAFQRGSSISFWGQLSATKPTHHFMTNKGLRIELPILAEGPDNETAYAILDCISDNKFVAIPISRAYHNDVFQRTRGCAPRTVSRKTRKRAVDKLLYLQKGLPGSSLTMYFSTITVCTQSLHRNDYRLIDVYPPHAALKIEPDSIQCGDSHRVLLLFGHKSRPRCRAALLITAKYTQEQNHLSRPQLRQVSSQIALGPRLGRVVDLVLDNGLWHLERSIQFDRQVDICGDIFQTHTHKMEGSASWAVDVDVDRQASLTPADSPWHDQDSESDGFEHISMAAIASMFNNTNRDFRQREAWVRRQERERERRGRTTTGLTEAEVFIGYDRLLSSSAGNPEKPLHYGAFPLAVRWLARSLDPMSYNEDGNI
ncbi:HET domain-containing protein [Pyricularia oryzae 70-15]|uniref:HET domain-containing protein n=3 Tax=Pyricularia oryzae TaxID=318829 RepID=G4N6J8_PYRO7|nr:HET domain-containing protein [Pyricularia oryzae 70-15]EHA50667.1 HET domain-containing protein [Pyricularia oryzae 70-15]ELQ44874.1 HET domain-containing protein [Pyricularia oryzae Y34]KAI7918861.1 HET domain-containing protein [Pyricularia oryzae]KAI7920562.1 HET domain-containing protein [Pyricularia oryzae]